MPKIDVTLSLTKAQWGLLSLGIKYIVPLIPEICWSELEEVDKHIDEKLKTIQVDEFIKKQLEEDSNAKK